MSTEQSKAMIDQLAEVGQSQGFMPILVFSGGEPLCRDDLFEVIEYAGSKGLILALATNGTLVDEDIAKKIKASGVQRASDPLAPPEACDLRGGLPRGPLRVGRLEGPQSLGLAGLLAVAHDAAASSTEHPHPSSPHSRQPWRRPGGRRGMASPSDAAMYARAA